MFVALMPCNNLCIERPQDELENSGRCVSDLKNTVDFCRIAKKIFETGGHGNFLWFTLQSLRGGED